MKNIYTLDSSILDPFCAYLKNLERSLGTIEKYLRDARAFILWLDGQTVSGEKLAEWKTHLLDQGYKAITINSMLAAINTLFRWLGWQDIHARYLRMQRQLFREDARALSREEYVKLLHTARTSGQRLLALTVETIGATGIRVSELCAITVEAAQRGHADIHLKGKIRTILIPDKLCQKLIRYAKTKKITHGEIFLTTGGKSLTRFQIWAQMKRLAKMSGVAASKVFPHNLRHLFAIVFYEKSHDIVRLADMLGHSSIETTRIYLQAPGSICRKQLASLGLVQ